MPNQVIMTHVVSYAGGAAGVEEVYRVEADVDILAVQVPFNTKFAATHDIFSIAGSRMF